MKIHVLDPYQSHAMQRMSAPLTWLSTLHEVTRNGEAQEADVIIHMPWHSILDDTTGGKHIMAYTHCNPPDAERLYQSCEKADVITCMSFRGRQELIELGADPKKLWVIYAGAGGFKYRRRVIGVVGNVQPNGRKRESILLDLAWRYDLSPFEFVFIGHGWEDVAQKLTSLGVSAASVKNDEGDLQKYYQLFDALLVTGYAEGGSLPILEAMAVGVPVISPDYGYAADFLEQHYDTPDELMDILSGMIAESFENMRVVNSWTWEQYAAEYALLISRIAGGSAEIFVGHGADRYKQLLDLIGYYKPKNLLEIGTWNGNRAIQMIQEAAKYRPIEDIIYRGYDLFDLQTGGLYRSELSKAAAPLNVVKRRVEATGADVKLIRGNTNETLKNTVIPVFDFAFIDGGHSEDTIRNDWENVKRGMSRGARIVFDDYYHEGKPEGFGCNAIIDNLEGYQVTYLPNKTKADDGRLIGMALVEDA